MNRTRAKEPGIRAHTTHARARALGQKKRGKSAELPKAAAKPAHTRARAREDGQNSRPAPAHVGTLPPNLMSAAREERLLALIGTGISRRKACREVGIDRSTLRRWLRLGRQGDATFAAFVRRFDAAFAAGTNTLHLRISNAGKEDWRAAAWLLERIDPENYGLTKDAERYLEEAREILFSELERFFGAEAAARFSAHLAELEAERDDAAIEEGEDDSDEVVH